jgi:hypothetical protein
VKSVDELNTHVRRYTVWLAEQHSTAQQRRDNG